MSLAQSGVLRLSVTYEKPDDLKDLGSKQLPGSPTPLESEPRDGGLQAWATVFGSFLMQFASFGYIMSFGVYQDFYTRIYLSNYSPSAISWIGALASFLGVNIALISGPLYDRGWFYHLMVVGSLIQSLSLFMLSLVKPGQFYLILLVQGVLPGIATGLIYAPSMAVISQHFSKRRTVAMSIVASGVPFGAVIHPIMLNHLLNGHVGFSRGVLASAGFVSILLLISCLSMRTKAPPVPSGANYRTVARKCSRDVLFMLMTVASTLLQLGFYFPGFYLQLDSVKHGIDVNFSFYSLVIMNAASFVGRCTAGIIVLYTGVLNLTIISAVVCSGLIISMIALSDIASVIGIGVIYGYFSGIYIALFLPLATLMTPDLSELGARIGIFLTFCSFSGLLSGPISGALLSSQYRWLIPTLFSGFMALVGSLFYVVMRLIMYRRGYSEELK
ncbi:MFS general substrate transporter [Rhizopogon vinicolor AM-OR11-026]|uniref:MFS general substrate transporter n=1 Tax=Rhizopogon vinicolor AM-OR11-026 TaxID=1314800 RepID=A0A1B7MLB1_9AGAM|nr:MFS general substrate transporter [Rhizopogon vinicolor AM-OR11-026]